MTSSKDTVLVVDDRRANRYVAVHALKQAGYEVIEAETGKDALESAKQIPAAILLDVKLPDILGYEICRRLKLNPRTSHIPVLQLSAAFADNESRVYALESGADAYLTQPVEPNVLVATVRSLIKIHEAEARAKLSAKQWQATFDALSEGVAIVDTSGDIQRCNGALCELLGRSFAEIEGRPLISLLADALGLHIEAGIDETSLEVNTGAQFFRVRIEPVHVDGVGEGSVFVLADITRQKLAENSALLNERLAATGRMAHTIAHEINNPLEAITNLVYLLKGEDIGSESAAEYLSSTEREVERVSRIARQILSFHRESSVPVEVDLCQLLEDVMALNNRAVVEMDLRIRKEWDGPVRVRAFPAQIRQVFSNLFRNAIEASHSGSEIRIRISPVVLRRDEGRSGARVTISDRGVGIPKENLARIFDAFFTTKELKGTGVGLWLSAAIVREHGGRIQVRSSIAPGCSGSCVSVLLPCERPSATQS